VQLHAIKDRNPVKLILQLHNNLLLLMAGVEAAQSLKKKDMFPLASQLYILHYLATLKQSYLVVAQLICSRLWYIC
jgi:hypothetical protein